MVYSQQDYIYIEDFQLSCASWQARNKTHSSPAGLCEPNDLERCLLLFSHPVPFMARKQQEVPAEMTHPVEAKGVGFTLKSRRV